MFKPKTERAKERVAEKEKDLIAVIRMINVLAACPSDIGNEYSDAGISVLKEINVGCSPCPLWEERLSDRNSASCVRRVLGVASSATFCLYHIYYFVDASILVLIPCRL